MPTNSPMPRARRLRRVAILCRSFAVNLAYYRVGRRPEYRPLLDYPTNPNANFWRVVNGNFIDTCVLEWCKLFGDRRGKHHWSRIVSDPPKFEAELLLHLGIDAAAFQKEIEIMRQYRDKFIAHLDSDETANIPALDAAKKAVWFYLDYVVQREAQLGDLDRLPVNLDPVYAQCEEQAKSVYERNL